MKYMWIALLLIIAKAHAQDNGIYSIKEYYYDLKEQMDTARENENPSFYVVLSEENVLRKTMPAVGSYHGFTEKWFLTVENLNDGPKYGTDGVLVYEKRDFDIDTRNEVNEFIYKNGALIFCFIKTEGNEYRYYFKQNNLIHFVEKRTEDSNFSPYRKEDWRSLLKRSKHP
ncbi:hypothetical protein [Flagellimonas algicola]|uniref:Uncharacterized protein n=1 Tax=Flagellimonas algicola TaxID=2583815 RepID=A0ABY2WNT3_9FLAO|nr:hypothetical protein [Allomuricauda algicola]TMU56654.1 hypothetical protein FGG15_03680 [Allomuricauda algicola]